MKIATCYDPKPIPVRRFDWEAWDDDDYEGPEWDGERLIGGSPVGYGLTEEEAINDLLDKFQEELKDED